MPFCYNCGKRVDEDSKFCQECGVKTSNLIKEPQKHGSTLGFSDLLGLVGAIGIIIGGCLLIGGLISILMNPIVIKKASEGGGTIWAIGYLVWMIFYPTGLIHKSFTIGLISLLVGIISFILAERTK